MRDPGLDIEIVLVWRELTTKQSEVDTFSTLETFTLKDYFLNLSTLLYLERLRPCNVPVQLVHGYLAEPGKILGSVVEISSQQQCVLGLNDLMSGSETRASRMQSILIEKELWNQGTIIAVGLRSWCNECLICRSASFHKLSISITYTHVYACMYVYIYIYIVGIHTYV